MFQRSPIQRTNKIPENLLPMLHPSMVFLGGAFKEILIFIPANLRSSRCFKQVGQTCQHSFVLMSPSIYNTSWLREQGIIIYKISHQQKTPTKSPKKSTCSKCLDHSGFPRKCCVRLVVYQESFQ